jgi:transposase
MQQFQTFVGIDISKVTLDICLLEGNSKQYCKIDNTVEAIQTYFTELDRDQVQLCVGMENTGCYNYYLYEALGNLSIPYYVIPPIHLKKSLGLSRGKNDKVDSFRIALFLESNAKRLNAYKPVRPVMGHLRSLLTARGQRIEMKKQISNAGEQYQYLSKDITATLIDLNKALIESIEQQVRGIEKEIQLLISNDSKLSQCYRLICSVQGVGKVLGWNLLVRTGEFDSITDPRKLACYAGVAPFDHSSGTSVRGKARVSPFADKTLKKLLHLAAMSAIRLQGDLRDYYQRKVTEGKNKMLVLNAVRNKIIHRVFAVLKYQRPYLNHLPEPLVLS